MRAGVYPALVLFSGFDDLRRTLERFGWTLVPASVALVRLSCATCGGVATGGNPVHAWGAGPNSLKANPSKVSRVLRARISRRNGSSDVW